jgi:serpin B
MRKLLHAPTACSELAKTWGQFAQAMQDPGKPYRLRIANRLFGEKSYRFEQPFLDLTRDAFFAPLEPVDFKSAPEPARQRINQWVEQRTQQRIKDLLQPPAIGRETRLVLVNAIYFLSDWAHPFEQSRTRPAQFTNTEGQAKLVPTMHQVRELRLVHADGMTLLELPYQSGDFAMLIALPDAVAGLAAFEKTVSVKKLAAWYGAVRPKRVSVALPSFTIEPGDAVDLVPPLKSLGMTDAFDERADFTAIGKPQGDNPKLVVATAVHKAFIKVNEKGTEAAAATAVVMDRGVSKPPPAEVEFHADHPFVYFIVHPQSGMVMFMGRVVDPSMGG